MQAAEKYTYPEHTLDPETSIFVSANAGSGKTSLLTARVLALLLYGVAPSKILCLTFTNGAAAEMSARVTQALGRWVMMEDTALADELSGIVSMPVNGELLARARSLFATVLDHPVGLRLQTIHGFCQSLLARFPLEAGVGLHLSVMDEATQAALLKEARMQLFSSDSSRKEGEGIYRLVQQLGEHQLLEALSELVKQKRKLARFIESHHGIGFAVKEIYDTFGLAPQATGEEILRELMPRADFARLKAIARRLAAHEKITNHKTAAAIGAWIQADSPLPTGVRGGAAHTQPEALAQTESPLTLPSPPRGEGLVSGFWEYAGWMLVDGRGRKSIFTKGALSADDEAYLLEQQACVERAASVLAALDDARLTANLLVAGAELIRHYEALKQRQGLMDFDDQIMAASRLLKQEKMSSWVMFKLDGGIDHVLVDEAQDTSPEQWDIVRAITGDFFAGLSRRTVPRSLFVVGDEKQSIFRFQGADPAGLAANRRYFMQKLSDAGMKFKSVSLTHSFRSAQEILTLVDRVFAGGGLSTEATTHQARRTAKGMCEIWPLAVADEERHQSAEAVLARQVAERIAGWVGEGVGPGDIMILVRRRKGFIHQLARALKRRRIPVAGVDRMELLDNLAVKDLLAFAKVLLLPDDDLTLAALLKSPLFGMDEETLFSLCHGRTGSLWQALAGHPAQALLAGFRARVDYVSPFALFAELLEARGFRRAFTGRMGADYDEALDVFLEQALLYEKTGAASMQGFIGWLEAGESEIKRDMEQAGGMVRIMTAHAAKGLQAKIVIVADSTSTPTQRERMQWPGGMPLAGAQSDILRAARADDAQLQGEEYRRLLYVALTRAEDMLVVCGAAHGKGESGYQEGAWYPLARAAFEALGVAQADGRVVYGEALKPSPLRGENPHPALSLGGRGEKFPSLGPAPQEQEPPRPLLPSQLMADAPAMPSPARNPAQVQKGVAVHRILQYVPAMPHGPARLAAAMALAKTHAPLLPPEALAAEALAVLDAPEHAPLFGPGSLAEVPVVGMVEWKGRMVRVLGQVDRLAVVGDEVWIIDFKSGAVPAGSPPAAYLHQMALYAAVLRAIYPRHTVRAALLWTVLPRLDWIDPVLLDETPASAYI